MAPVPKASESIVTENVFECQLIVLTAEDLVSNPQQNGNNKKEMLKANFIVEFIFRRIKSK